MKRKRRKVERKEKKRNVKEERKEGRSSNLYIVSFILKSLLKVLH